MRERERSDEARRRAKNFFTPISNIRYLSGTFPYIPFPSPVLSLFSLSLSLFHSRCKKKKKKREKRGGACAREGESSGEKIKRERERRERGGKAEEAEEEDEKTRDRCKYDRPSFARSFATVRMCPPAFARVCITYIGARKRERRLDGAMTRKFCTPSGAREREKHKG